MATSQMLIIPEIKEKFLVDFWDENSTIDEPYGDNVSATATVQQLERNVSAWITSSINGFHPNEELRLEDMTDGDIQRNHWAKIVFELWDTYPSRWNKYDFTSPDVLRNILHSFLYSDEGRFVRRNNSLTSRLKKLQEDFYGDGNSAYDHQFEESLNELIAIQEILENYIKNGVDGLLIRKS